MTTINTHAVPKATHEKYVQIQLQTEIDFIRDSALAIIRPEKNGKQPQQELSDLLRQYQTLQTFKYALAEGIAAILAQYDKNVISVHIFDPSLNPDAGLGDLIHIDVCIHMLVQIETASAGLSAFILSLDRCLTHSLKGISAEIFDNCESVLDLVQITRQSVEQRSGYGALLTSYHAPPLQVFQR